MISGLPFVTKLTFKRAKASRWTYTKIPKCQSKNLPECQSTSVKVPECQSTKAPKHLNGHANVRQRRNVHEASVHVETNDKFVKYSDHNFFSET